MKIPFAILSAGLLASCGKDLASNPSIASGRYAELAGQETRIPKSYLVAVKFTGKGGEIEPEAINLRPGQKMAIKQTREFIYPAEYALADASQVKLPASQKAVSPVTPVSFAKKDLGYTGELKIEQRGAFVVVRGDIQHLKFDGFSRAPGEAVSPLIDASSRTIISDNRVDLPNFTRTETPVFVAGLPGRPHVIDLPSVPAKMTITCEPVY